MKNARRDPQLKRRIRTLNRYLHMRRNGKGLKGVKEVMLVNRMRRWEIRRRPGRKYRRGY